MHCRKRTYTRAPMPCHSHFHWGCMSQQGLLAIYCLPLEQVGIWNFIRQCRQHRLWKKQVPRLKNSRPSHKMKKNQKYLLKPSYRKSEFRNQQSELRNQNLEIRSQKSDVRYQNRLLHCFFPRRVSQCTGCKMFRNIFQKNIWMFDWF